MLVRAQAAYARSRSGPETLKGPKSADPRPDTFIKPLNTQAGRLDFPGEPWKLEGGPTSTSSLDMSDEAHVVPTMDPGVSSVPLAPTSLNDQRMVSSPNACRSKLTPLQRAVCKDPAKAFHDHGAGPASMQHHPQMSTATKVELELARQRAEKAMAGETGLQQTWRGLPRQHRTGAPCAVLAGSPAVYGCSAAPSQ